MKRTAGALLLAVLSGCVSAEHGPDMAGAGPVAGCYGGGGVPPMVPGVQGPWGAPCPMIAPYAATPPGAQAARAMLNQSVPLNLVQASNPAAAGRTSDILQAAYTPPDSPPGGSPTAGPVAPPGGYLSPPGVPGAPPFGPGLPPGAVAAAGAPNPFLGPRFPTQRTEVRFLRPSGMKVSWFTAAANGGPGFATTQIDTPGRYNFPQGAIYRLRLSEIPGWTQLGTLYPTLEVWPSNGHTDPFLAHSAVPVEFTNEDFRQVAQGNLVVKVIYLPNPNFQEVAVPGGLAEINTTQLEAGVDPILEAQRRGTILLIIRLGNIDLELNNSPPMNAPSPFGHAPVPPGPGFGYGAPCPPPMVPYGMHAGQGPQGYPGPMMPAPAGSPNGKVPVQYGPPAGPGGNPAAFPVMQGRPTQTGAAAPAKDPTGLTPGIPVAKLVDAPEARKVKESSSPAPSTVVANLPELPAVKQVKYSKSPEDDPLLRVPPLPDQLPGK